MDFYDFFNQRDAKDTRILNSINRYEIFTPEQLYNLPEAKLLRMRGIGKVCYERIQQFKKDYEAKINEEV